MTDIAAEHAILVGSGAQPASPGRALGAAREARGISVEQVAESLRFAPRQIQALERDDYASLPGATVVRGMVRNYAKLVGLDADPLIAELRQRLAPAQGPLSIGTHIPVRQRNPRSTFFYAVLSVIVALVGIAVVLDSVLDTRAWFKGERVSDTPAVKPEAPGGAVVVAPPVGSEESTSSQSDEQADAQQAQAPSAPPLPEGVRKLRFKFDRESWVEVRTREGTALHLGLNAAGTERVIEGKPPFVIVIGAAAGVQLTYDDQPVDLARYIKIDVARLTLE